MRLWGSLSLPALVSAAGIIAREDTSNNALEKCPGYTASNVQTTDSGLTAELTLAGTACNVYGEDLKDLILQVTYETDNRLHVKIQDAGNQVYQVPESVFARSSAKTTASASHLQFAHTASPFSFKVTRRDTGEVLFDTSAASLVFESQYLRLRTALPSDPYLYGLGEHSDPFRLNTTAYIRTLWNQDSFGIPNGANLYGAHPFYLEQRATGAHGVLFLNSNGMDIMIDQDTANSGRQYLEYNTLGGVLDFYFFAGPSPVEVSRQYGALAGTPAMQPYWGLGFHNCRYGYQDAFDVAEVVYNYSAAGIPLETMWTDIDYMDRRRVFSLDPERYPLETMRAFVSHLHERDQHYVVMVDPAVAYQDYPPLHRGIEQNAFLLRANGSAWVGVVWPGVTVFPDWFAETADTYWTNEFKLFFDRDAGLDIDALWIDMNEPSNFPCNFPCDDPYAAAKGYPPPAPPVRAPPRSLPGWPCQFQAGGCTGKRSIDAATAAIPVEATNPNVPPAVDTGSLILPARAAAAAGDQKGLPDRDLLYPKYAIHNKAAYQDDWNAAHGGISNHTINTDVMHQNGLAMYDTHNMYGSLMSIASREAMLARRPGLRPLIITRSTFAGAGAKVGHWLGDNLSTWQKYRESIRGLLAFSALFQFGMVGSDVCGFAGNTTEELCARWAALGAFSSFYRNHNEYGAAGQEFYRWPSVATAARKAIDIRYRLMDYFYTAMRRASVDGTPSIAPVFFHYPDDRAAWPLDLQYFYGPGVMVAPVVDEGATAVSVHLPRDRFYDWYTHKLVRGDGRTPHTFSAVDVTTIPLLIRAGVVIPLRARSANTTTELRRQDFELLVPLDERGAAAGELYMDDGVSVEQAAGAVTDVTFAYEGGVLRVNGTFATVGEQLPRITKVTVLGEDCKTRRAAAARGSSSEEGKGSRSTKVDISLTEASSTKI
ncbi:alpha-glucosidase [Cordyceps fumosorosea ARSEF 2679]|uniref:Alpha-glucosidase n=1 Tax=Cordyceps fumosorosea (strain ARSEF 2679) TaxID=1081104 RepID=A0A167XJ61_CORFA|nr:alpha-glucosidase [Cordyceps fumosorosea ARSEF 2679]OAA65035.1 alpha-glucosidase [Cordyceps fumosorosea ARSEF 2679]